MSEMLFRTQEGLKFDMSKLKKMAKGQNAFRIPENENTILVK